MKRMAITLSLAALFLANPAFPATSAPAPPAKPHVKSGARLDEVHIKGEIPEPQVLFVVGRERRRFLDFQHRRYLATRQALQPSAPAWDRVVDTGQQPIE
jgi:hypothetical protein